MVTIPPPFMLLCGSPHGNCSLWQSSHYRWQKWRQWHINPWAAPHFFSLKLHLLLPSAFQWTLWSRKFLAILTLQRRKILIETCLGSFRWVQRSLLILIAAMLIILCTGQFFVLTDGLKLLHFQHMQWHAWLKPFLLRPGFHSTFILCINYSNKVHAMV